MKNFIFFITILITLCSCERNEIEISNSIIGEWKLVKAEQYGINSLGNSELYITDYTSQNVIYSFQTNNLLKISGGENIGYSNGEFSYEFKKGYLSDFPMGEDSKLNLVIMHSKKWVFNYSKSQMTLNNSYIDGPTLIFEKK